jgi:hypothetical protein
MGALRTAPAPGQDAAGALWASATGAAKRPRAGHLRLGRVHVLLGAFPKRSVGVGGKTRRASLRRAKQAIHAWGRRHRHQSVPVQHAARSRRLRGSCNDFGVSGKFRRLLRLVAATKRVWYKWLCRRSQRKRLHWGKFEELLRPLPLPRPRLMVRLWGAEARVTSTEEPDAGNPLVRIWRGAGVGNLPAYSTTTFAQFLAVCRRSKIVSMGTR